MGNMVCTHKGCGLVLEEGTLIDGEKAEQKSKDGEDNRRTGGPESFSSQFIGMNTTIGGGGELSKAQKRLNKGNDHLVKVLKDFGDLRRIMQLPEQVRQDAFLYYQRVYQGLKDDNKKFQNADGLKAACLMKACEVHRMPRQIKEI